MHDGLEAGIHVDFEALSGQDRIPLSRRATVPSVALEPAASSLLLHLTQARIGDTLHDGTTVRA